MTAPFPTFPTPSVEHEIQRQMLERLGIEWTPGEPFVALVEDEIVRLRAFDAEKVALIKAQSDEIVLLRSFADVGVYSQLQAAQAEVTRLRALVQEHITQHDCLVCGSSDA